MKIQFLITMEVEREEGKFASKDELRDYLREELETTQPTDVMGVGADGESSYAVTDYTVEDYYGKEG